VAFRRLAEAAAALRAAGHADCNELSMGMSGDYPAAIAEGATMVRIGTNLFGPRDRKSTRLNSSHVKISYAVFCLKKKKSNKTRRKGYAASKSKHYNVESELKPQLLQVPNQQRMKHTVESKNGTDK